MYKNMLIAILSIVLVTLITMIYFGTPNIEDMKDTYELSKKEQKIYTKLAEDGNVTAMEKLKAHCAVMEDANCTQYLDKKMMDPQYTSQGL